MRSFLLKRLALAIPTLLLLSAITFLVGSLAPSDPATTILRERATPEAVARLRHELGLDRPLWRQYLDYVGHVCQGDFGISYYDRRPVLETLAETYPETARLAGYAILLSLLLGVPLGLSAAACQDRWVDRLAMGVAVVGVSLPSFVLGSLLILVFAQVLGWLPVAYTGRPLELLLPALALGSRPAALIARITRASVLEALRQDYVRTALAKGLSRTRALLGHALRNALVPILTVVGVSTGYLLAGSFVVESVFVIPGIGRLSLDAITRRDYPVLQAVTLLGASAFVLVNLLVDVAYACVDPRVRSGMAANERD
ncbi:MAG: ABC transporter permease [Armatimonadetes bacterium]|nr:ABC transporter permease [Armatimonadota bacterium]